MIELEQAIQNKKDDDPEAASPGGSGSTDPSTLKDNSDTEFSKELEAALQMLQDLGSPNTIETPSEPSRSITMDCPSVPPEGKQLDLLGVDAEIFHLSSGSDKKSEFINIYLTENRNWKIQYRQAAKQVCPAGCITKSPLPELYLL